MIDIWADDSAGRDSYRPTMSIAIASRPSLTAVTPPIGREADESPTQPAWLSTRPELAVAPLLVVVAVKVVVNLAVASRYGWHRDELYYADTGRHLSFGYVDFPPITPWLARVSSVLFGQSLVGLRSLAVAAGAGTVVLTALITRDLGGRRWAQVLAAIAITPLTLGSNAMFQTVSFDQLAWGLVLWAAVRVLHEGGTRRWVLLGAAVGVAWMTKFTVGLLIVGLLFGLVITRVGRSRLRGPGPSAAAALALAIAAPNLWWQMRHGWPSFDFFTSRANGTRADNPPSKFLLEFVLGAGVAALPLWLIGIRRLLADAALRPIGIAVASVLGGGLVLGGKAYYAGPVLVVAFAAGSAALERRLDQRAASTDGQRAGGRRRLLPILIVATTAITSPLILPVATTHQMVKLGLWQARDDYAEEVGWPDLVDTVADVWHRLPAGQRARAAIVAGNYGEAGAIDRWGPARDLPAAVSGHLSRRYWRPDGATLSATEAILVGFDRRAVARLCRTGTPVARVTNRLDVENEEQGGLVWQCHLRGSVADRWPDLVRD